MQQTSQGISQLEPLTDQEFAEASAIFGCQLAIGVSDLSSGVKFQPRSAIGAAILADIMMKSDGSFFRNHPNRLPEAHSSSYKDLEVTSIMKVLKINPENMYAKHLIVNSRPVTLSSGRIIDGNEFLQYFFSHSALLREFSQCINSEEFDAAYHSARNYKENRPKIPEHPRDKEYYTKFGIALKKFLSYWVPACGHAVMNDFFYYDTSVSTSLMIKSTGGHNKQMNRAKYEQTRFWYDKHHIQTIQFLEIEPTQIESAYTLALYYRSDIRASLYETTIEKAKKDADDKVLQKNMGIRTSQTPREFFAARYNLIQMAPLLGVESALTTFINQADEKLFLPQNYCQNDEATKAAASLAKELIFLSKREAKEFMDGVPAKVRDFIFQRLQRRILKCILTDEKDRLAIAALALSTDFKNFDTRESVKALRVFGLIQEKEKGGLVGPLASKILSIECGIFRPTTLASFLRSRIKREGSQQAIEEFKNDIAHIEERTQDPNLTPIQRNTIEKIGTILKPHLEALEQADFDGWIDYFVYSDSIVIEDLERLANLPQGEPIAVTNYGDVRPQGEYVYDWTLHAITRSFLMQSGEIVFLSCDDLDGKERLENKWGRKKDKNEWEF